MDRQILKGGLHRDLLTKISVEIENKEELYCSLVIRENVTRDYYIFIDEVE